MLIYVLKGDVMTRLKLQTEILWQVQLQNTIFGGVSPTLDPFDASTLYIADGFGSSYTSMRLRRLDLTTGNQTANILLRNAVRCMHFSADGQYIFAVTDNKIYRLCRHSLQILEKYEKGVPKYSDFIASNERDTLILSNRLGGSVVAFNYVQGSINRKKLKDRGCRLLRHEHDERYLITTPVRGSVQRYDVAKGKIETLFEVGTFNASLLDKKGNWYFHPAVYVPAKNYDNHGTGEQMLLSNKILMLGTDGTQKEWDTGVQFKEIRLSADGKSLFLLNTNSILKFVLSEEKIVSEIILNERLEAFFEKQNLILCSEKETSQQRLIARQILKT